MRDWLKNVLVTLYERDEDNNLLTEKQKLRVKKIHENEKRLEAGDHPVELLARDFEKNYNMYIFPVHWQFGQLDQHPIDGYLSHTELAPLRAPLIPMEHCTTRFFETCDLDHDKYIALDEWAGCFGIKERECLSKGATILSPTPLCFLCHLCVHPLCPVLLSVPS